eukprot:tig00000178_g12797.t1
MVTSPACYVPAFHTIQMASLFAFDHFREVRKLEDAEDVLYTALGRSVRTRDRTELWELHDRLATLLADAGPERLGEALAAARTATLAVPPQFGDQRDVYVEDEKRIEEEYNRDRQAMLTVLPDIGEIDKRFGVLQRARQRLQGATMIPATHYRSVSGLLIEDFEFLSNLYKRHGENCREKAVAALEQSCKVAEKLVEHLVEEGPENAAEFSEAEAILDRAIAATEAACSEAQRSNREMPQEIVKLHFGMRGMLVRVLEGQGKYERALDTAKFLQSFFKNGGTPGALKTATDHVRSLEGLIRDRIQRGRGGRPNKRT